MVGVSLGPGPAGRAGLQGPPQPAPEDRPQQPLCLQTWTSARLTAVAATTTVPTWPAPSSAPARPASGWTRTAGAAPVSLPQPSHGPLPGAAPTLPSWHLPSCWLDRHQPCLLHWGTGWGSGCRGVLLRQVAPRQGATEAQLLLCPSERRDAVLGMEGSVQRGRALLPSGLWVPRSRVGPGRGWVRCSVPWGLVLS